MKKRASHKTGESGSRLFSLGLDRFPPFGSSLRKLEEKKFTHVRSDLAKGFERLLQDPYKQCNARPVRGVENVYKARIKSKDLKKGSRGGFRIFYYIHADNRTIYPLYIIVKSEDRADVAISEELIVAVEELNL